MRTKAAVIKEKGRIELDYLELPVLPADYVRVRVRRAGICGTDMELYKGTLPYLRTGRISYPVVPGHEWAGEVVEVGTEVKKVKVGDRVSGELHLGCGVCDRCRQGQYNVCLNVRRIGIGDLPGAIAEYIQVPEKLTHKLPESIDYKQGSLIEPTSVALKGTSLLSFTGGERVIVFGPGSIGLMAANACRVYGAGEIILVDKERSKLREEISYKLGADRYVTFSQLTEEMRNAFDITIESSGAGEVVSHLVDLTRPGGQILLLGIISHPAGEFPLSSLVTKNIRLYGSLGSAGIWENAIRLIERKALRPELIGTHEFTLDEVAEAFANLEDLKKNGLIKATMLIS